MIIKVLGSGCAKCHKLEENTRQAVAELGLDAIVEKVKIMGRVPTVDEIKKYL